MVLNLPIGIHKPYQTEQHTSEKLPFFFYSQSKFHFTLCIKAKGKSFEPSICVKPLQ